MAENDQPPAPHADAKKDEASPPAPPAAAGAPEGQEDAPATPERAVAEPIKFKRPEIYETLKKHLEEANHPEAKTEHMRVHEHCALQQLQPVREFDPLTGEFVMRPHWKVRVLLAWWKAHGLEHHSRISPQHFAAALHEALHGRI